MTRPQRTDGDAVLRGRRGRATPRRKYRWDSAGTDETNALPRKPTRAPPKARRSSHG
jgi:hypothetical protein